MLGLRRGRGLFGLRFIASSECRLDHFVSVGLNARETILDFDLALVEKIDYDLHILIEFVRHVVDSILNRF